MRILGSLKFLFEKIFMFYCLSFSNLNLKQIKVSVTDLLYFAFILTRSVDLFLSTGQQTLDLGIDNFGTNSGLFEFQLQASNKNVSRLKKVRKLWSSVFLPPPG